MKRTISKMFLGIVSVTAIFMFVYADDSSVLTISTSTTSTGTITSTGSTSTNTNTGQISALQNKINNLFGLLNIQKANVDALLAEQNDALKNIQKEAMTINNQDGINLFGCLNMEGVSDLDWSLPTDVLTTTIKNGYLDLDNKINSLETRLEMGDNISSSEIDALTVEIGNYGEVYKQTIIQTVQKTTQRFDTNKSFIQKFISQNQTKLSNLQTNMINILKVEDLYKQLQINTNSNMMFYGFSIEDIYQKRQAYKDYFTKNFNTEFNKQYNKYTKNYGKIEGFSDKLSQQKNLALITFQSNFDEFFDGLIGKYIEDTHFASIDSLYNKIQNTYSQSGELYCNNIISISDSESKLITNAIDALNTAIAQIPLVSTGNTQTNIQMKRSFIAKLFANAKQETKTLIKNFKSSISIDAKVYNQIIEPQSAMLDELNAMNDQYRSTRDPKTKADLRAKMIQSSEYLLANSIHQNITSRAKKVNDAMQQELYYVQNGYPEDAKQTSDQNSSSYETSSPSTETSTSSTTNANTTTTTNTQNTSTTNTNSTSTNTATSTNTTNANQEQIKKYIDDINTKYTDPAKRKAAIQVVISNIDKNVASGNLSKDTETFYLQLKVELTKLLN